MASDPSSLSITSTRDIYTAGGFTVPTIRLRIKLAFSRLADVPLGIECLLDTGAPLSVIPHAIHSNNRLAWQPLPGPWPPGLTTWLGVPCTLGRIDVWIPNHEAPLGRGPLSFVAKFAHATPPRISGALPILLGLNFLADHRAEVALQCHTIPDAGSLQLP